MKSKADYCTGEIFNTNLNFNYCIHFFLSAMRLWHFLKQGTPLLSSTEPKPGRRPNRTESFLSQKSLTERVRKTVPGGVLPMASKVHVRPGTGSHTKATNWEQCELSLVIRQVHVVPFVFLLPNITTSFA